MAHSSKHIDIAVNMQVVFNRYIFLKTIKDMAAIDLMSKTEANKLNDASEFMVQKAFNIMMNRYPVFVARYAVQFAETIVTLN